MRLPIALLATGAALAAAAPAQAADLTLDVMASGTITANSTMDDGLGNTETIDASVDLEHQVDGLYLADGEREASRAFTSQRLFGRTIGGDRTMQTHTGTLRWTCSAYGEAAGAAGDVRVRRESGDLLIDVGILRSLEGNTICSGASETGSSYRLLSAPLVASLRVPESALGDGTEIVDLRKLPITCIQGDRCSGSFTGSVVLRTPLPQEQSPQEQPAKPAPAEPKPTPAPPAKPAPGGKPTVKTKRTKQGAKVTVTCAGGCGGKVSALSVARAKQLAAKPFKTQGSAPKVVVLKFPKRTRGNVVIDVRTGTSKQRVRLRQRLSMYWSTGMADSDS